MTVSADTRKERGYRYRGYWLGWRFSEFWTFDSPLPPDTLKDRLEASWDQPFRVFGRSAWKLYPLCAVFLRDGTLVIRDFKQPSGEFERPLTPTRFGKQSGQRFRGQIVSTPTGSRIEGWAEYGNIGRNMFVTIVCVIVFAWLVRAAPDGPANMLLMLASMALIIQGIDFFGGTLLAPR
ncbi:MAG: hypothetical protein CVT73_23235, partial [Alphaproteobacteria bacterium HGW-Alphaproteobacteria-12]